MYCPKCGTNYPDGFNFCNRCGIALGGSGVNQQPMQQPVQQPVQQPNQYQAPNMYQQQNQYAPRKSQPKSRYGSTLFLVAVICFSVNVLLTFCSAVSGSSSLLYTIMNIVGINPYSSELSGLLAQLTATSAVTAIVNQLPEIAICVALWLIAVAGRGNNGNGMSPAGELIIKIVMIIKAVLYVLGIVIGFFAILILGIIGNGLATYIDVSGSGITGIAILALIGILIGGAVGVFYYVKVLRLVQGARVMALTGQQNQAVTETTAVAVFTIIFAVGQFFGMFSQGAFGVLAAIAAIAAYVCFAIFLLKSRSAVPTNFAQNSYASVQPAAQGVSVNPPSAPWQGQQNAVNGPVMNAQPQAYRPAPVTPRPAPAPQPVMPNSDDDFGTTVLGNPGADFGNTTILSQPGPSISAVLTRVKTGERAQIHTPSFKIGKSADKNDFVVSGNTAISRTHAEIAYQNGSFYIIDLNSSNHVYVNGQQAVPGVRTALNSGDVVFLADEEFTFEI